MSINTKRGFTLMELLVVIAIIGILASVVLASLNTARSKGADAAVKSNINNARAQAELYYDNQANSYLNVCTAATGILNMKNGADSANGAAGSIFCADAQGTWVLGAQLVTNTSQYYCADSTGKSTTTLTSPSGTACP